MDADRQVTKYDEYKLELWGTLTLSIYARHFDQAYKRFDSLFKDGILNGEAYVDVSKVEQTGYGRRETNEKEFRFEIYGRVYETTHSEDMDYDEDAIGQEIYDELVKDDSFPEYVVDHGIKDIEAIDLEWVDSGYFD